LVDGKITDKLENNKVYQIKVSNINPFYYKTTIKITQKDKVKQVFEFLKNIVSGNLTTPSKDDPTISERSLFKNLYNQAVLIDASLKTPYLDDSTLENIEKFKKKNILLSEYLKISEEKEKEKYTIAEVSRLNNLMNEASNFISEQHQQITLGQFKTDGTDYTFELTFTPPTNNVTNVSEQKTTTLFTSKSYFKVYFSTGLMLANPVNSKYYVSEKNENNQYTICEESRGKYSLGIMSLAHFMKDIKNSNAEIGISIGGGIDLDTQLRFLVGGSFIYNKVAFNIGYNWAYKDVLSDKLRLDKEYSEKPELANKKVLKGGYWLGISYVIF
jgi:hypothetical protein